METARFILLYKLRKVRDKPSAYLPIVTLCMPNLIGKLFEKLLITDKLQDHLLSSGNVAENQYSVKAGKSMLPLIRAYLICAKNNPKKKIFTYVICAIFK
jgi:hypothetical protein